MRGESGAAYNVGSPHEISIADLARTVVREIAPDAEIQIARQPVPGAPALRYVPATSIAPRRSACSPWISLEEGIRRTWEWHRNAGTREEIG